MIVTLKELRISKGLNQAQCAEYLGMSTRNYQNYENDAAKANTARYHAIYQKLESYGQPVVSVSLPSQTTEFHTNVVTGTGLQALANSVAKYGKRDCFRTLQKFVAGSYDGKICILYGLRRTGKTTLLFQMLSELPIEKTAYIKVQTTDDMSRLTKDLKVLFELGYRYVFIDEITLLSDFIDTAAVLSDVFSMMGMKIVVSGTDSLGFAMANRDELYDRSVTIHTSFIPFREYARLLNIRSVDSYIEYGGTLKMENMSFDDPDAAFDEVAFRDDESTRKYIDTAISRNIQHTLKNDHYGEYFNQLRELYEKGELTNVINRIVHHDRSQVVGLGLGIEFMAVGAARYDFARFGFEVARASPRQADMIMVAGTITHKMAPVLKRLYDQMADPKYVIAVGGCAISGGPFKKSYHVLNGVDKILPVDVYIPGCPPRPEALLYGMIQLQRKVKLEKFFGGVNRKENEPQNPEQA